MFKDEKVVHARFHLWTWLGRFDEYKIHTMKTGETFVGYYYLSFNVKVNHKRYAMEVVYIEKIAFF